MSTLDATVSMLEVLPEKARIQAFQYVKQLFTAEQQENPYAPVSTEQVLADLELSERQIGEGRCRDMQEALTEMGRRHGFL